MQDRIFYAMCFGFVLGVFLRSLVYVNIFLVIFCAVIAVALILFFIFISQNRRGIVFSIFILVFSLGIFRFHAVDKPVSNVPVLGNKGELKINISGTTVDEPDVREHNQKLTVETKIDKEEIKILITTDFAGVYRYGDQINIKGVLMKPSNFVTDQGKEFDYINYLRKDGILYLMNYPEIEIVSRDNGNFVKNALFSIKNKFLEKINFTIKSPENLLMGGLILGEKSPFSPELRQNFVDTGTIHIVALSGYNVTIVAEWFMKLFSYFPKNFGIGMGIFAVLLFVLMTGASSTAVRAGIMAILALFARATGRNYDVGRALILAGVLMIVFNPFVLVFDVSFQLSFIATIAVIFLAPRIERYFLWIPRYFGLRDIVSVTTSAYVFVCPFILYKMGSFSLVALPANILILPFIPLTMLLGFLTGFTGIIWHVLGVPFGYLSYLFLHYELGVVKFFADFSFAAFSFPRFPLFVTVLIYVYFIYRLFGKDIKNYFTAPL